jgi:hypothetical protein
MTCPAPNRWSVRKTQERALRAASVASHVSWGSRQLSQLPQSRPGSSSKWARSTRRRQVAVSQYPSIASTRRRSYALCASSASDSSMRRRRVTASASAYRIQASLGSPSRPARPVSW